MTNINKRIAAFELGNPVFREVIGCFGDIQNWLDTQPKRWRDYWTDVVPQYPPMNVREVTGGTEYIVEAPGFNKEDFSVEVTGGMLHISGVQKNASQVQDDRQFIRREFDTTSFRRSLSLSDEVDASALTAKYENGILTVFVPLTARKEKTIVKID
jgi:HSP20 family protein